MVSVGHVLNKRYKLERFIGSGGTATVFLAKDLILDRQVAVKILRTDFSDDDKALKRFQREAKAISLLAHPNIVSLYDVDNDKDTQYLVMEYIDGMDLKKYICHRYPLSLIEVVNIMKQIIKAVHQAHQQGIIHRDLKTQNVLIDRNGMVKITDFGIATGLTDTTVTQTNTLMGSIHYLSPEQARGSKATHQSDIYALGIILYELIMGDVPFTGDTPVSIAMKHFQSPIPSVVNHAKQTVPQSLENVILKATAKQVKNRYQNCSEMFTDLQNALKLEYQSVPKFIEPQLVPPTNTSPNKRINVVVKNKPNDKLVKQAKSSKKSLKLAMFLGAFVVVLVSIIASVMFMTSKSESIMPNVVGKTQQDAVKLLTDTGLIVEEIVEEYSDTVAKGNVISVTPEINTTVQKNTKVKLTISLGIEEDVFRDYVNQEYNSVYQKLIEKGYIVERKTEKNSEIASGYIISQSIKAGTKLISKGKIVTLTVSSGAVTMMNYVGQSSSNAKTDLESLGFSVIIEEAENSHYPKGTVIAQSVPENTKIDPNTTRTITLTSSLGIRMPDFSGWNRQAVENRLSELGLAATFKTEYSNDVLYNEVIQQSILPGASITNQTDIEIIISLGAKEERTTTTQTTTKSSRN